MNSIDQEMKKVCGTGYKNTVLKERTEQGEGFGHVSDIVGDVSEDTRLCLTSNLLITLMTSAATTL